MPSKSESCAILTAADSGSRLCCEELKAFAELSNRPLAWWTARGLHAGGVGAIVITASVSSIEELRNVLFDIDDLTVVAGSDRSRQKSVALGPAVPSRCEANTVILIRDAIRPLTPPQVITHVINAVRDGASAVVSVLPITDTLRTVDAPGVVVGTPRHSEMVAVQTPQGFRWDVFIRAYEGGVPLGAGEAWTVADDAGLIGVIGGTVHTVADDERSAKMTRSLDLVLV